MTWSHPPAADSPRRRPWALGLVGLLWSGLLLPRLSVGPGDRLAEALFNWLHFPGFVCIAGLLWIWRGDWADGWRKRGWLLLVVGGLAAAAEWIQPWVGRSCEFEDWVRGMLGAAALLSLVAAHHAAAAGPRWAWRLLALALLLGAGAHVATVAWDRVQARRAFPLLASFESDLELGRWEFNGCAVRRVPDHATAGASALRLEVTNAVGYPGLFLRELPRDARGLQALCADVFVAGPRPLQWVLRVDDRPGNPPYAERVDVAVWLAPGPNRLRWDRAALARTTGGRPLDFAHLETLGLFRTEARPGEVVYLDNVRLEWAGARQGSGIASAEQKSRP